MLAHHIVFDLDGTLWDPMEMAAEAWRQGCHVYGIDETIITHDNLSKAFGHPIGELGEVMLPGVDPSIQSSVIDRVSLLEVQLIPLGLGTPYPDLHAVMEELALAHKLYICSNCQKGYIEAFLQTYSLEHLFSDTICAGDTGFGKGANLALLLTRNAIDDAVMVGDMDSDRNAAIENRIPFIHATYGFGEVHDGEMRIDSLMDLANRIRR